MGVNLEVGKQSFESLLKGMEKPTKMRFVVWLDEKLAEYKVQGYMNFVQDPVPKWIKSYSKYMSDMGLTIAGEFMNNKKVKKSSQTLSSGQPAQHSDYNSADRLIDKVEVESTKDEIESTGEPETSNVSQGKPIVKAEPADDSEEDVVMVLPEAAPDISTDDYEQTDRQPYRVQHTVSHQRSVKTLRPPYRFAPKNSYAAAVAARKRRFKPDSLQQNYNNRPAETVVFPQHLQPSHIQTSSQNQHIVTEQPVYPETYSVDNSFTDTDPAFLSEQMGTYSSADEYIQFPMSTSEDPSQLTPIKSEQFYNEDNTGVSFNEQNTTDEQLDISQSLDGSYAEGGLGEGASTSGTQDSWVIRAYDSHQHKTKKPHLCHTCNESFTTQQSLQRHYRRHTGERPHVCSICLSDFSRLSTLYSHIRRVHHLSPS